MIFPPTIESPCELRKLRDHAPRVPPRTEGRTNEHCETWVSCHFLAAISESDLIGYPLDIKKRDKPDLVLSSSFERTGLEITEAVHPNQARVDAYRERNNISCVPCYPHEANEEKFPKQKIGNIAKGECQQSPIMSNQIERVWVHFMLSVTRKKSTQFTGYVKYDRNWLLIYDNLSPYADLDSYPDTTGNLGRQLFNQDWQNPFDRVFILRSRHVWEFSCGADAVRHAIP